MREDNIPLKLIGTARGPSLLLVLLMMVVACRQLPQTCSADGNHKHRARPHSISHRSTLLYGVISPYGADAVSENMINISVFRLRRDGHFVNIPPRYNPNAFATGYAGMVEALTASPDGRFLFAECKNTDADGNYRPFFLQYRILPSGQLKPDGRYGVTDTPGATHLVFHPSGRYAYLSWPDPSSSQARPGAVVQIRVTGKGDLDFTPIASVPCGPMPTALALDGRGRVGAVLDAETGFLWQYALTPQGRLQPTRPASTTLVKEFSAPVITGDGQFMYVASEPIRWRCRIYQLHHQTEGGFSRLMPWAVRVPGVIFSMALSNKHRVVYASVGTRLLSFRISRQGTLQPGAFSMTTTVGVDMVVDEATDCLYVLGLHNMLRAYRIHEGGTLTALSKAATHVSDGMRGLTVVHR